LRHCSRSAVIHNPSEVLVRLCAGSKLGIDATKKFPGEGFRRPRPPRIKMDAAMKAKVEALREVCVDFLTESIMMPA